MVFIFEMIDPSDLEKLISRNLGWHESRGFVYFSALHHVLDCLLLRLDVQQAQSVEAVSEVRQNLVEETVGLKNDVQCRIE
jgi:hypothetical protein